MLWRGIINFENIETYPNWFFNHKDTLNSILYIVYRIVIDLLSNLHTVRSYIYYLYNIMCMVYECNLTLGLFKYSPTK